MRSLRSYCIALGVTGITLGSSLLSARTAQAADFVIGLTNGYYNQISLTYINPAKLDKPDLNTSGPVRQGYAGMFDVTMNGHTFFNSFCIDLLNDLAAVPGDPDSYSGSIVNLGAGTPGVNNPGRVGYLFQTYGLNRGLLRTSITDGTGTFSLSGAQSATALQLAMWELTNDNGAGFQSGLVRYDGGGYTENSVLFSAYATDATILRAANFYLADSIGKNIVTKQINADTHVFEGLQQYNSNIIAPTSLTIPEPGSAALAATGVLTLIGIIARRRRRTSSH